MLPGRRHARPPAPTRRPARHPRPTLDRHSLAPAAVRARVPRRRRAYAGRPLTDGRRRRRLQLSSVPETFGRHFGYRHTRGGDCDVPTTGRDLHRRDTPTVEGVFNRFFFFVLSVDDLDFVKFTAVSPPPFYGLCAGEAGGTARPVCSDGVSRTRVSSSPPRVYVFSVYLPPRTSESCIFN